MQVLVKPDTEIFRLWNKQIPSDSIIYKPIKYLKHRVVEEDNIVVLENLLTIEVIFISVEEYNSMMNDTLKNTNKFLYQYLIKEWFLIPNDMDERSMVHIYRNKTRPVNLFDEYINQFVILTTTGCNARCSYCYEKGSKPVFMTEQTAIDVADYIIKKSDPNIKTHIRWFGGEPIYNAKAIDTISRRLEEKGRTFWSSIITNAYEFDDDMAERAKSLWNLKRAQVTLDGTHNVHNKVKNFKAAKDDPFYRTLDNIDRLCQKDIEVSVRLNVERENVEDMRDLITYLGERYKGKYDNKLSIYTTPIFEGDFVGFVQRDKEWRNYVYKMCNVLEDYIGDCGLNTGRRLQIKSNTIYNTTQCMADFPQSQLIAPDGSLGVCEHHIEDSFFGSIYGDIKDFKWDEVTKFRELADEYPECKDCWYYPRCIRLKLCPTNVLCNEGVMMDKDYLLDKSLYNTYLIYKANKGAECDEGNKTSK